MKITALQEYGLRCVHQLALGGAGQSQTASAIAEKEGLSRDYVEKILFQLRKTGLVASVRGINGGYILARDAAQISIGEVLLALSEKPIRMGHLKEDLCAQFPGKGDNCVHLGGCSIRMLWSVVMAQVFGVLNQVPLSTLVGTEEEVQARLFRLLAKVSENSPAGTRQRSGEKS